MSQPEDMTREEMMAKAFENHPPATTQAGGVTRTKMEAEGQIEGAREASQQMQWENIFTAKLEYILENDLTDMIDKLQTRGVIDSEDVSGYKALTMLASKSATLGFLRRDDIGRHQNYFDAAKLHLKKEGYKLDSSITLIMRQIYEMWISRSIDFRERIAQITTRSEQEVTQQLGMSQREEGKPWYKFW